LYPVPSRLSALAGSVEQAFSQYRELAYLRTPLKYSFTLTLSLVLAFTLLAAVWLGFLSARRLTAPVRDLVMGTRAVAAGDYSQRLPQPGNDDIGMLVRSFNEMTRRLALSREAMQRSQQEVEEQKAYLEVVLGNLSTGVLTFDRHLVLITANRAAEQILGVALPVNSGQTLAGLAARHEHLQPLREAWTHHLLQGSGSGWQAEVTLFGARGRQVLICRGSALAATDPEHAGQVVVFDDITALIQAQRDAAWGEVARRLAHEIKNPLTPIQLSAERLRHKCSQSMNPADRALLERHTETIVQQVEMMKGMVNAFSEYARPPRLQREPLALNALLEELLELYRSGEERPVQLSALLDPELPLIDADPGRLRQLLHNLLKNAHEALADTPDPQIAVSTRRLHEDGRSCVELEVRDNGPGLPSELRDRLFEPYITTKPKGTGLGLAIVKKIVEEHGGMIAINDVPAGGFAVAVRLPVTPPESGSGDPAVAERTPTARPPHS
ncbi:MAG TPA: ATP-binding protein, partial [Gammaproteobacteria bacterium]